MASFTLTDSQKACLEPARNRMVSAGAGSGKTFLLVRKIIDLLCNRQDQGPFVGIENILALTFTRKAAGEMSARVHSGLLDALELCDETDVEAHLESVKDALQAAKISTIHSFAASLIRSNPVAAEIDPNFEVVDEAVESVLVRNVARATLHQLWTNQDDALKRLLELWEPYQIRSRIEKLLHRPIELHELVEGHDKDTLLSLLRQIQNQRWEEFRAHAHNEDGGLWRIEKLSDRCRQELRKKAKTDKDFVSQEKAELLLKLFLDPLRDYVESTSVGTIDAKELDDFQARVAEIQPPRWRPTPRQIMEGLREALIPWCESLQRDEHALDLIGDFLAITRQAWSAYDRLKQSQVLLSNDDLLLKAWELCRSRPQEMRGTIRHILVDEFQDTDPVQWEIILALAKGHHERPRNMFLVGDTKQAIYGFRGADHTITTTAHEMLSESESQSDVARTLNENFRSLSTPLNFSNELFDQLFGDADADHPYGVPPQSLISFRSENGDSSPSSTSFLVSQIGEEDDPWAVEAQATVRFLRGLRDGKEPAYQRISELMSQGKPAIGILFRTYAPMDHYVGELTRVGLPFSVYHGRTFYETPEVVSLINMIAWLADPLDDAALVSVLRSPLFPWTDQDLLLICRFTDNSVTSLMHKLEAASHHSNLHLAKLVKHTVETLTRIRKHSDHLSLSETLRTAIDETLATFTFAGSIRGPQCEANVEKFLSVTRELEAKEGSSAQTVLQAIRQKSDAGPGESEAEGPSEYRGAIQLMTIHAAKGLEFPLVVVANSGKSSGGPSDLFPKRISHIDSDDPQHINRLTLCGIDFPDEDRGLPPYPTILKSMLKEHDERQKRAEERRLLYVALTRAEDHIVLPVMLKNDKIVAYKGSHAWFIKETVPELAEAIEQGDSDHDLGTAHVRIMYDDDSAGDIKPGEALVEDQIRMVTLGEFRQAEPHRHLGRMPYRRAERVSVTELMTFSKCPRRFYLDRFFSIDSLGFTLDKASTEPMSDGPNNVLGVSAALVGTLVHRILESHELELSAWESGSAPPDRIIEALDHYAGVMAERSNCMKKPLTSEAVTHLQNIVMSGALKDLGSEADGSAKRVLREITFELRNDEIIVAGTIDRLAQMPDDSWSLCDYKTTRLNGRTKEEILKEEAYDLQLWTYAWAANQILGAPVTKAAIVFTSDQIDPVCNVPVHHEMVKQTIGSMLNNMAHVIDQGMESYKAHKSSVMCSSCSCSKLELC